jgi:uncharacterized lipoprotein
MNKYLWGAAACLLVAACSSNNPREASDSQGLTEDAPNVSPTAAPGVAFRYFYTFELPDEAISAVQEKHASRCESLGVSRCRITGLNYTVSTDNAVSGSLTVKLAPDIARQFGKDATTDVRDADGRLSSTEFSGEDTEPVTTEAGRQQSDIQRRISDLEKQLAATSKDAERAQLQSQLNELRSQASQAQATIAGAKAQLASTPMTFNYYGRGGISGFRTNPATEAARLFVSSLVTMITFVLRTLALLLPWLVLIALLVLAARSRFGRRVGRLFVPKRGYSEDNE